MTIKRKNITVSVSEKSYRRAKMWAANSNVSVSYLVEAFLSTIDMSKSALKLIGYTGDMEELYRRLEDGK